MQFSEFELLAALTQLRGSHIVTIQTRTTPKMLAKHPLTGEPNPFKGNVVKIARVNGMIGWQYAKSVNRQRDREELPADFRAVARAWGRRLPGTPLVSHEGKYYLEVKVQHSDHRYQALDGGDLVTADVEAFARIRKPSRQRVDREIVLRDYATSSITSLLTRGVTYTITQPAVAVANAK